MFGVVTDVAGGDSVDELGARTFDAFGTAHALCNNAGVAGGVTDGLINVSLWGVIHGHRVFLPKLIEQGEGHIINTASIAGHMAGHSAYSASR